MFRSVVGVVLDFVAPLQTKFKQRGPKSNRWLTPEAVNAKHQRRHLEKRWKRSGDETVRIEYRRSCRTTNRIITDCRSRFIKEPIDQATNSRQQWKTVKNLLHTDANSTTAARQPEESISFCKAMAEFFRDKILNIKASIANQLVGLTINLILVRQGS